MDNSADTMGTLRGGRDGDDDGVCAAHAHVRDTPRRDIVWAAAVYGSSEMEQASGKAQGVYAYAPYQAYAPCWPAPRAA